MKVRIISAVVGLALLSVAFLLYNTIGFTIIVSLLAIMAVFELMKCAGLNKHLCLLIPSLIYTGLIPFLEFNIIKTYFPLTTFVLVIYYFIILLKKHKELNFGDIAITFAFSFLYPLSFSCFIFLRNSGEISGLFYILMVFIAAWLSDTGAYFTGYFLGKHKLCPEISPKKTVEGAIGGLISAIIGYIILAVIFNAIYKDAISINYLFLIITPPCPGIMLP